MFELVVPILLGDRETETDRERESEKEREREKEIKNEFNVKESRRYNVSVLINHIQDIETIFSSVVRSPTLGNFFSNY